MTEHPAPATAARPAAHTRRSRLTPLWVTLALLIGAGLGVGGTLAAQLLLAAPAETEAEPPRPIALDGQLWFDQEDVLPSSATPPGSRLTLGERATILVSPVQRVPQLVDVSVEAVALLTPEQTELLRSLQPALEGQTLYRIDFTVTPPPDVDLTGVPFGEAITPITADGVRMLRVPVEGWKVCGNASLPAAPADNPTGPRSMCVVGAAPPASTIAGAEFSQPGGPYSVTIDGQVTWLPAASGPAT